MNYSLEKLLYSLVWFVYCKDKVEQAKWLIVNSFLVILFILFCEGFASIALTGWATLGSPVLKKLVTLVDTTSKILYSCLFVKFTP